LYRGCAYAHEGQYRAASRSTRPATPWAPTASLPRYAWPPPRSNAARLPSVPLTGASLVTRGASVAVFAIARKLAQLVYRMLRYGQGLRRHWRASLRAEIQNSAYRQPERRCQNSLGYSLTEAPGFQGLPRLSFRSEGRPCERQTLFFIPFPPGGPGGGDKKALSGRCGRARFFGRKTARPSLTTTSNSTLLRAEVRDHLGHVLGQAFAQLVEGGGPPRSVVRATSS